MSKLPRYFKVAGLGVGWDDEYKVWRVRLVARGMVACITASQEMAEHLYANDTIAIDVYTDSLTQAMERQ